ncbi:MAG: hypothetical protein Hyperionvirus5_83 [Hyperionvirus sp.]|uniref:Ankyrin repeat protein n=1 Tax=Hyperionvirus sp. TaxID=2487770 RepID=A0A3G5A7Q5_9VIRU|nr:MAG: hypothetical protein Hyperionvirus5_83 [Hyperionvirus sp.]
MNNEPLIEKYQQMSVLSTRKDLKTIAQLEYACSKGNKFKLESLLKNVDFKKGARKDQLFRTCCYRGFFTLAEWLYKQNNVDPRIEDGAAFRLACCGDQMKLAKWLFSLGGINNIMLNKEFRIACTHNRMEMAVWLYSLGKIDIRKDIYRLFLTGCEYGYLEMIQWLKSLSVPFDIHAFDNDAFYFACFNNRIQVAKWLYKFGGIDVNGRDFTVFKHSFVKGNLDLCKWVYSLGAVDVHMVEEYVFIGTWRYYDDQLIWIFSLGQLDIHGYDDIIFRCAARNSRYRFVVFLLGRERFSNLVINSYAKYYDDAIVGLVYKQGYEATDKKLKDRYILEVKKRVRYFKKVSKMIGSLVVWYYKICDKRYSFGKDGFREARSNFMEKCLKIGRQAAIP